MVARVKGSMFVDASYWHKADIAKNSIMRLTRSGISANIIRPRAKP